jgi:twitching motility protein PilT
MTKLQTLLSHLQRPGASQLLLTAGRPPRVLVGSTLEPVGSEPLDSDAIIQLLFAAGGSRHVDALGAKPIQWRVRIEGIGSVAVSAVQRGDEVEAQFVPPPREAASVPPKAKLPAERPPSGKWKARVSERPVRASERPGRVSERPARKGKESLRPPPSVTKPALRRVDTPRRRERITPHPASRARSEADIPQTDAPKGHVAAAPDAETARVRTPAPTPPVDEATARNKTPSRAPKLADGSEGRPRRRSGAPKAMDVEASTPPRKPDEAPAQASRVRPPIGRRFLHLLAAAKEAQASDLHVIAERPPLFRVSGELVARGASVQASEVESMVDAVVPTRLAALLAEIGSCDFALDLPEHGRFRANVSRQKTGLKICLRLIPPEVPTLGSLGIPGEIAAVTRHHQGLVVVTGPTGHGKTTTLAAIVGILNTETTHHVITVEDPIEFVHPRARAMMSQREVGAHTRSFQAALKASLREDPDVIVVGELRDTETVRMALSASETGHLVLGTMNTPSAARAIERLIDLFPPADQPQVRTTLASGLRMIIGQRLLPAEGKTGMVAAVELLPGSLALSNLIRENKTFQIPSLQQRGKGLGIVRLNDSLAELVIAKKISTASALAVTDSPEELDTLVHTASRSKQLGQPVPSGPFARPVAPAAAEPSPRGLLERAGALFGKKGS